MNLESVFLTVVDYYQSDNMRLIGLITWIIAWRAAYLFSRNLKHAFKAHILYTIANCLLLIFNAYYGHIEMAAMAITFLYTSVKGCYTYWPSRQSEPVNISM